MLQPYGEWIRTPEEAQETVDIRGDEDDGAAQPAELAALGSAAEAAPVEQASETPDSVAEGAEADAAAQP